MRRFVLLATLPLVVALPAWAKMPPFDMEVETHGDTVHITVTINGDESLIHDFDSPRLNGLLAVLPADQVDRKGRPTFVLGDRTEVPLKRVELGLYQGTLEQGEWAVVPFPEVSDVVLGSAEGWYPETVLVEVSERGTALGAFVASALRAITLEVAATSKLPRCSMRTLVNGFFVYALGGSCCTAQRLPSGSAKNTNRPQGKSSTSLASTPRSTSWARAASASSTTNCRPSTEPGAASVIPTPIAIEHADPGGVS